MNWVRKIIFTVASLASIVAAVHFSFGVAEPNDAMTGIWLAFALITFLFGWPEVAESVSFLGNSIKLREVKNALHELKQLAEVNSKAILELYQGNGRLGGFSETDKQATYESIERVLAVLKFKREEIEKIQAPWHSMTERDYVSAIVWPKSQIYHNAVPAESSKIWHEKLEYLKANRDSITPQILRDVFKEVGGYTNEVEAVIDDYEYYLKNKRHRNLEKWQQRYNWFEK